ncbi:hypothetical protein ACQ86N_07620 [Puia sp. P3]|uniref:hypothetical protein n=1 Tax=Puia sp. P3 TaxID=3423952 RepID=UPI003D67A228
MKNKIQTFRDIFNVVPRSVVASDLGKENDRFMELTDHLGEFTIQELALIGNFCSLTLSEMFTLIGGETITFPLDLNQPFCRPARKSRLFYSPSTNHPA